MAQEQDMKHTRKKHNAAFKACPGEGRGRRWRWRRSRATGRSPSWRARSGVHPNQIYNWKKQLLDGATSVFEGGGAAVEGTASEAQVDVLYRQIGQLKVENDFLARRLGK